MTGAFAIDSRDTENQVIESLCAQFGAVRDGGVERELTYHDTFDWRLYCAGTTLATWSEHGQPVVCWRTIEGRLLQRLPGIELASFVSELPDGAFREALADLVDVRRLLPVVRVKLRSRVMRILDGQGKTVARILFERGSASAPDNDRRQRLVATVSIAPLRGYEKAALRVVRHLEKSERLESVDPCALTRALTAIGRRPLDVDVKLRVGLERSMSTGDAMRAILSRLFELMRLNEAGVRGDLDSEFLHDFRVAVRRTRSALGQIRRVLPPSELERFREDFKWLGSLTGPTRDLDVYLLKLPAYAGLLPPGLRDELGPLRDELARRQRIEHARLVEGLDSDRYRRLMEDWPRLLERPWSGEGTERGLLPAVEVASKRIRKIFRRVLEDGEGLDAEAPPERLHRLRIDGKKLRYLLEFFQSLYAGKEIGKLVRDLKKLQDNLGDFNDYEVQQHALAELAEQLGAGPSPRGQLLVALGRLVERLRGAQAAERDRFRQRFDRLASQDNRRRVRELFGRGDPS